MQLGSRLHSIPRKMVIKGDNGTEDLRGIYDVLTFDGCLFFIDADEEARNNVPLAAYRYVGFDATGDRYIVRPVTDIGDILAIAHEGFRGAQVAGVHTTRAAS